MSDTDSGGDSLEIDEVIIGFDHMSARTKSNQTTKDDYKVCVPNVCEKLKKEEPFFLFDFLRLSNHNVPPGPSDNPYENEAEGRV